MFGPGRRRAVRRRWRRPIVLAVEAGFGVMLLGKLFERFDVTEERRAKRVGVMGRRCSVHGVRQTAATIGGMMFRACAMTDRQLYSAFNL